MFLKFSFINEHVQLQGNFFYLYVFIKINNNLHIDLHDLTLTIQIYH